MQIPRDALIPDAKITRYLLVHRSRDDKSLYLAQAGFTQENPDLLIAAIRSVVQTNSAVEDKRNSYGIYYKVIGDLMGPSRVRLRVATIWLRRQADDKFQFVTLKPFRSS